MDSSAVATIMCVISLCGTNCFFYHSEMHCLNLLRLLCAEITKYLMKQVYTFLGKACTYICLYVFATSHFQCIQLPEHYFYFTGSDSIHCIKYIEVESDTEGR